MKNFPLSIIALSVLSSVASAQTAVLEEVFVTADFREQTWLASSVNVSVFDGEAARDRAATHLEEMLNTLPNINFSAGSNRARYIQIRGIGERSQFKEPINPSVGLLIDGADMSGQGSIANLFDIDQVEVLRGPQGTRYGANALAGLVKINSVAPVKDQATNLALSVGNYGTYSASAAGGTELSDAVNVRLAVQQQTSDGFYYNSTVNRDDTNGRDELSARFSLRYQHDENLRVDWRVFSADMDNGYDAFTLDNSRTTLSDQPGQDKQNSLGGSVNVQSILSSALRFESDIAIVSSDGEYGYDEDWAFPTLADGTEFAGWEYSSYDNYLRDNSSQSVDLRLLSNEAGRIFDNSTDWVVGVYHLNREQDLLRQYTYLEGDFVSQYDTTNKALYGQLDVAVTDSLSINLGARSESWSADYVDNGGLMIATDEQLWGANIGLNVALDASSQLFATLSRGYKPGGVNTDGTLPVEARDFATELLYNTEVGYKWQTGSQRGQVTVFHARRHDQQVKGSYLLPRADGSTEFIDYVDNAAQGTNQGIELEWHWLASDDLSIDASAAYLDASFDRYFAPATQADPNGLNLSGRAQAHAPNYQGYVQANYQLDAHWFIVAAVETKDAFYFSDRHNARSEAYSLINAQLGYRGEGWTARLWGRNLGNRDVMVRGFGSFGNDPRNGYEVGHYVQFGEPRVYGITADWEF